MNLIKTSEVYDQLYSEGYRDTDPYTVWDHNDLRTRQVLETLRSAQIRPHRLLDYGCGAGSWIRLLETTFPSAKIAGIDISKAAIDKAKSRFPNGDLHNFDGILVPFPDAEFDLVFSYHVLEHVDNIDASIKEIARVLRPGGYAIIIFPCGNEGSFLSRTMRLIQDAWLPTADGRAVLFFEVADGHVRRMTSRDTVGTFGRFGLEVAAAPLFSGHLFGTIDWLCRGTGPAYINKVFAGRPAIGRIARVRLEMLRRLFLAIHRLILLKSLDLNKKRNPLKQMAVLTVKQGAMLMDNMVLGLSSLEWQLLKRRANGTAQYLIFRKT